MLKNDLPEIHRLADAVHSFGKAAGLNNELTFDVNLVLEEIVTNIISYAHDDEAAHEIVIRMELDGKNLTLKVEDDGKPFDPLDHPTPDIHKPLEERDIGGLGVFFVRELMDTIEYERKEGKNILLVKKELSRG